MRPLVLTDPNGGVPVHMELPLALSEEVARVANLMGAPAVLVLHLALCEEQEALGVRMRALLREQQEERQAGNEPGAEQANPEPGTGA